MNRTLRLTILPLLAVLVAPVATTAASLPLLPVAPGDLVPTAAPTTASDAFAGPDVSHDPVRFSWPTDRAAALAPRPLPATATSRQYWLHTTAAALARGVVIPTSAPAALVRLNPAGAAVGERSVDPAEISLEAPDGRIFEDGAGMELVADAAAVSRSDAPFVEGTSAFRIRSELGAGRFVLRLPATSLPADTPLVIHVLEAASPIVAALQADHVDVLAGNPVTVRLRLTNGRAGFAPRTVTGDLIAPSGERLPLDPSVERDHAVVLVATPGIARTAGLWEVEARVVATVNGLEVRRDVRTAFAAAQPTARLGRVAGVAHAAGHELSVALPVETASTGRYEVRAVLWGTDDAGRLVPAAVGAAADWLPVGNSELELQFAPALLAGLRAPFELRDLQLTDQGRMGVIHRQARALVID